MVKKVPSFDDNLTHNGMSVITPSSLICTYLDIAVYLIQLTII
jgi:hypothetical protein